MRVPDAKTIDPLLVTQIVRSYVAHNRISAEELPNLIAAVHRSLTKLWGRVDAPSPTRTPAIAINRSYGRDFVICLDCGWRGQMLRRHLTTAHGLSPRDYRARWNLKSTHPLTAPGYTERRSTIAKQLGLGHRRQPPQSAAALAATPPASRPAEAELDPAFTASLSQPKPRRGRSRRTVIADQHTNR
jgi:predicted transcriptional regulator